MTTEDNQFPKTPKGLIPKIITDLEKLRIPDSEIPKSSEPPQPLPQSERSTQTPSLPRGTKHKDREFRRKLFDMDESHPGASKLAQSGEWYIRAISNNDLSRGRDFGISGSTGCGKTHVARGIYRFVQAWGVDICFAQRRSHWGSMWIDWPNVAELDDEEDFKDVRYELERATFVVIDDLGSETDRFKNGVSASRLRRVLSLIEHKWVVLTTNLTLPEMIESYDIRVADRLRAFNWVELGNTPSYRSKLKESK